MIQPARVVVPSNAPPLPDATEGGHASGVLQEHSGNRQLHDYSYAHGSEQKYPAALSTENTYVGYQQPQPAQHVYRQTPLQRHHYQRYGHSRYHHEHPEEQARREKQARFLYGRFRSSDHYMKYRNRQHTGKEDKAGQANVWPDRLELAFFRALVQWPPMGRRKLPHKEKQRGRNELIADYIEELTGEKRTRKQVSSHIQVLKPFVQHDPHIMRWLSKDDMGANASRHYSGRLASMHDARRASHYTMQPPVQHTRPAAPALSKAEWYNLSQHRDSLEVFEPNDFQMFVQRKFGEDQVERLHTYTSSLTKPRQPDMQLHDCKSTEEREEHKCRSLDIDFPLLAAMHQRRPLDCNVLVAEASLALAMDNFKDETGGTLPGVELGISFLCRSRHLPANAVVHCQNTFYKDGNLLKDQSSVTPITFTQSEDGRGVETQVKFGSTFWAKALAFLANRLRSNIADSSGKDPREGVIEYLQNITACQEIGVLTETGIERLLVIYWKFRLSTSTQGRAYWMRILLPPTSPQTYPHQPRTERVDSVYEYGLTYPDTVTSHQPLQPSLQSPFEYDSATAAAVTWPDDTNTAAQSAIDLNGTGDNAFDFAGGNINISYDPASDFSNFDSSAFNFDADAAAEFAADPALQDFSQEYSQQSTQAEDYSQSTQAYSQSQEYSQSQSQSQSQEYSQPTYSQDADYSTQWVDNYNFDSQQSVTGASNYPVLSTDSQSHHVFDAYSGHYDQTYAADGQAYGGAGQDVVK